jgi:hypothetical protein
MKLKLFQLLKNVSKWVFNNMMASGKAIGDAEEKFYFGSLKDESK